MPKKDPQNEPWSKPCSCRIERNRYGENMCGAIGCCDLGDMPCCASKEHCATCGEGKGGRSK